MQFAWLSLEEARRYLARVSYQAESYGDRLAMERRCAPRSESDRIRIDAARRYHAAKQAGDIEAVARILDETRAEMAQRTAALQERSEATRRLFMDQAQGARSSRTRKVA